MRHSSVGRTLPALLAFGIAFGGCGGSQATNPLTVPPATGAARPHPRKPLLYIKSDNKSRGGISILSFPDRKPVAAITGIGFIDGICSDSSGNVWAAAYAQRRANLYEFAHGSTTPLLHIILHNRQGAFGCAADPTTGNLAVLGGNSIDVLLAPAYKKDLRYSLGYVTPFGAAFDAAGNLFFDGIQGSTAFFLFAELAKGAGKFQYLTVDKPTGVAGGIVWDGQYIAVQSSGFSGRQSVIYRVVVSGTTAHVVGSVDAKGINRQATMAVHGGMLVADRNRRPEILLWHYPSGGAAIGSLSGRYDYPGVTISI